MSVLFCEVFKNEDEKLVPTERDKSWRVLRKNRKGPSVLRALFQFYFSNLKIDSFSKNVFQVKTKMTLFSTDEKLRVLIKKFHIYFPTRNSRISNFDSNNCHGNRPIKINSFFNN